MRLTRFVATALSLALLFVVLSLLAGCAKKEEDEYDLDVGGGKGGNKRTALKEYGTATIKGHVRLAGDRPDTEKLTTDLQAKMQASSDHDVCLSPQASPGEKQQPTWRLGKGVGNVFVMLRPEKGTFFALDDKHPGIVKIKADAKARDEALTKALAIVDPAERTKALRALEALPAVLDQPHCAFVPHAVYVVPEFRDESDKTQKTGEVLLVLNTSPVNHNTNYSDKTTKNPGNNVSIGPGQKRPLDDLRPSNDPVGVSCSIHSWMNATIWVLDHPFVAITDDDGYFEIKNVPVGKVRIVAWHEETKYVNEGDERGEVLDLPKEGEVAKDFTVRPR